MQHRARRSEPPPAERLEGEQQEAELTAMLEDLYGGRAPEPTASPPTDAVLAEAAQQAQDAEPTLAAGQIRAHVEHGWATLDGEVDSAAEQQQAGRAALEVPGIQGVYNRVRRRGS